MPNPGTSTAEPTKRQGPLLWLSGRSWRFRMVIAIAPPLLYVASIGPACWLMRGVSDPLTQEIYHRFYSPIWWLCRDSETRTRVLNWYTAFFVKPRDMRFIP